jgi:glycerophosphoryl diester phosphodiesterase
MKRPLIIAHRGASAHAPENTMLAFERAISEGADGIEFDVWKCGSGEIVVTHNRDVRILTGRAGNLEKLTLPQLRKLDFGAHKSRKFHGEKIPTLEEVLDLAKHLELINIEIKGMRVGSNGIELDVAEAIIKFKLLRRVVVSSFNPATLLRIQGLNPAIRNGLLIYEKSPLPLRRRWSSPFLHHYSVHPSIHLLNKKKVIKAHQHRKKVIAWTINNIHQLETCIDCHVDAMITDDPAWMLNAMRNK